MGQTAMARLDKALRARRITRYGVAEDHLPAVEHYDQAGEAHARILPRQRFQCDVRVPLPSSASDRNT